MITAYINANILDGSENMTAQSGLVLLVEDDKIKAVQSAGEGLPEECEIVDLAGKYVLPGLINLHVHIPASGKPRKKPMDPKKTVRLVTKNKLTRVLIKKMYESYAKVDLMSGVTTIRTVGGVENYDSWLRDQVAAGKIVGPRILASNMAVSVPGGHMAGSLAYEATSAENARQFVRKIAEGKPDLIKLMITGGVLDAEVVGEPGVLRMQPELVKAASEEAAKLGYYTAAHVESAEGLKVALENGVHTIEHGAKPTAEIIRLFREKNAALVTTISPAIPYALFDAATSGYDEIEQINGRAVMDGVIECAKECLENDIPVGLGTDTGVTFITHYDFWRELCYFTKYCGVSNQFALYTATKRNAEIAGISDITGTIEPGKSADFIVVDGDPISDLSVLRNVRMVSVRGQLIREPKVKRFSDVDQRLDRIL